MRAIVPARHGLILRASFIRKGRDLTLTAKQRRFIDEFAVDRNGAGAVVRAGYAPGSAKVTACRLLTRANVRQALAARERADAERLELDREKALAGFLDVVDMVREKREPAAMVAAWREIGKMCGL